MIEFIEQIKTPKGYLEIIVTDKNTGEIIRKDGGPNQIQDWAKHSLVYMHAGRIFSTWGNHGEVITDTGPQYQIKHYKDGTDGTNPSDIVDASPWIYDDSYYGLIQVRDINNDSISPSVANGTPLYPFFPTKMRFGVGGLDSNQNPRVNIPTDARDLQSCDDSFPFILVERTRAANDPHIDITSTGTVNTENKTTFSCKMPAGDSSYPYNGYIISEAGLFCDAAVKVVDGANVYTEMRTGILFAYRTFYGIAKNESIDITFRWSFVW